MRRRQAIVRKDAVLKRMSKWLFLIILISGWLGVSYAAYTDHLTANLDISSGNMNFTFDEDKKCFIDMWLDYGGKYKKDNKKVWLSGMVTYEEENKIMTITNIRALKGVNWEPIDFKYFEDGKAKITIKYEIIPTEDSTIQRPAEVLEDDIGYDLGVIPFELQPDSAEVSYGYENGFRGWGAWAEYSSDIDLSDYLPGDLGEFKGHNIITKHSLIEGAMAGTITLQQINKPDSTEVIVLSDQFSADTTINAAASISDFGGAWCFPGPSLPKECILPITATYSFSIPLDLDQFNVERDRG